MLNLPSQVKTQISLAPYTTFKIGGPAKYFMVITTQADLLKVMAWVKRNQLSFYVMGAGGNVLVSDQGYDGLVIVMQNDQLEWTGSTVIAGAGVKNGQLIAGALHHRLGGLQWLIGVPGTIGGSIYGNAGGHGWGLGDAVVWVETLSPDGDIHRFSKSECQFSYRHSRFKRSAGQIITQACLKLFRVDPAREKELLAQTIAAKQSNQPITLATAGCMFTNPTVNPDRLPADLAKYVDSNGQLAAWRLINYVDLSGYRMGQVQISTVHANFMINLGRATADQVVQLISLVKQRIRDKLGIQLTEEIQYLGF